MPSLLGYNEDYADPLWYQRKVKEESLGNSKPSGGGLLDFMGKNKKGLAVAGLMSLQAIQSKDLNQTLRTGAGLLQGMQRARTMKLQEQKMRADMTVADIQLKQVQEADRKRQELVNPFREDFFMLMAEGDLKESYAEGLKRISKNGLAPRERVDAYNKTFLQQGENLQATKEMKVGRYQEQLVKAVEEMDKVCAEKGDGSDDCKARSEKVENIKKKLDVTDRQWTNIQGTFQKAQAAKDDLANARKTAKDVNDRLRYQDTGELVFPDVKKEAEDAEEKIKTLDKFKAEDVLRKEFQASAKDFSKVRDSAQRVEASATNPSPAGDLSLIFNFMKILDPGSVVRESEFANAQTAQEFTERNGLSWSAIQRVWEGEKLSDVARNDFVNRAKTLFKQQQNQHKKRVAEFTRVAENRKLDVGNVILDITAPKKLTDAQQKRLEELRKKKAGG